MPDIYDQYLEQWKAKGQGILTPQQITGYQEQAKGKGNPQDVKKGNESLPIQVIPTREQTLQQVTGLNIKKIDPIILTLIAVTGYLLFINWKKK